MYFITLSFFYISILFLGVTQAALNWPLGLGKGIFMALAIPIDLPKYNVFLTYNFEANYGLPKKWDYTPPAINGTDGHIDYEPDDYYDDIRANDGRRRSKKKSSAAKSKQQKSKQESKHNNQKDTKVTKKRKSRSLLSRKTFYKILQNKFEEHGLGTGDQCILRLICELNGTQMGEVNGVLGNLMHVMFSPSSSMGESLPDRYYEAEAAAISSPQGCAKYYQNCDHSVLDFISQPLIDFVTLLIDNNKL